VVVVGDFFGSIDASDAENFFDFAASDLVWTLIDFPG